MHESRAPWNIDREGGDQVRGMAAQLERPPFGNKLVRSVQELVPLGSGRPFPLVGKGPGREGSKGIPILGHEEIRNERFGAHQAGRAMPVEIDSQGSILAPSLARRAKDP